MAAASELVALWFLFVTLAYIVPLGGMWLLTMGPPEAASLQ